MKEEPDIPIVEIYMKEIKDTNVDFFFISWRPISSAPKEQFILLAILPTDDESMNVVLAWYDILGRRWVYVDPSIDSNTYTIEENDILGWHPIPTPPKEKII